MAMSDDHKAALARGRREAAAIKRYLDLLAVRRPGRPVTRPGLEARLADLEKRIDAESDRLRLVELLQQRIDLRDRLAHLDDVDVEEIEAGFTANVGSYSERKGISYAAWREAGVPAALLRAGGVKRTAG